MARSVALSKPRSSNSARAASRIRARLLRPRISRPSSGLSRFRLAGAVRIPGGAPGRTARPPALVSPVLTMSERRIAYVLQSATAREHPAPESTRAAGSDGEARSPRDGTVRRAVGTKRAGSEDPALLRGVALPRRAAHGEKRSRTPALSDRSDSRSGPRHSCVTSARSDQVAPWGGFRVSGRATSARVAQASCRGCSSLSLMPVMVIAAYMPSAMRSS